MADVVIVSGLRTAIGSFMGGLGVWGRMRWVRW